MYGIRLLVGAFLLAPDQARAAELIPIVKLDLLGGQFFFENENTSFGGNSNWLLSPGIRLSDQDILVPTLSGRYRRTREVRELIGGGFLTQESLDNLVSVKYIRILGERWSVKPNVSFKNELITESEDEKLGKGLFDYSKLAFGVELERQGLFFKSIRQNATAYGVRFYRYSALSSQSADFGTEIQSGDRVLNFDAYDYSIAADFLPREGMLFTGTLLGSYRPFGDQNLVTVTGEYEAKKRRDLYAVALVGYQQKLPDWKMDIGNFTLSLQSVAGLNLGYTLLDSNQHNYDASQTRFNENYYDYGEVTGSPFYFARFNEKLSATVAYDFARRDYGDRPAQEIDATYLTNKIYTNTHSVSLFLSYPVWSKISLKVQGTWRSSGSNMKYETTYRYNYKAYNYFVGLGFSL